jgi:hypothetical protein
MGEIRQALDRYANGLINAKECADIIILVLMNKAPETVVGMFDMLLEAYDINT